MIFVTGDTHGLQDFRKLHIFAGENQFLTKKDFVIIAGDCGAVWSNETLVGNLRYYKELPFTVLFIDGNHENFDLLNSFPEEIWNGGRVHKIRPDLIHLMRGQVFEIEGKTIFTFGGATSIDREYLVAGRSWWKSELPTVEEFDEGMANLKRYGNKIDYIITHACGQRALAYPAIRALAGRKGGCPEVKLLSAFEDTADFKHWYFGHFHTDARLSGKYTAIFDNVVELGMDNVKLMKGRNYL